MEDMQIAEFKLEIDYLSDDGLDCVTSIEYFSNFSDMVKVWKLLDSNRKVKNARAYKLEWNILNMRFEMGI